MRPGFVSICVLIGSVCTFYAVSIKLSLYCVSRKMSDFDTHSKTCVKRPLSKRLQIGFQDKSSLIEGYKYSRMLQGEHSAILLTFIKLPFVIKILVLSIIEWPFYTSLTVCDALKFAKPFN